MELLALCLVSALAGFIDSVVGGGGLIQLPGLFLILPPQLAASIPMVFGTNKLASICGTTTAAVQYSRKVQLPWATVLPAAIVALFFSLLGAHTVSILHPSALRPLVFVLLVITALITYARKDLGDIHAPRLSSRRQSVAAVITGAIIGFYDGFFGPGTGTFLIFIFIGVFGFDFLIASASAKIVNAATNLAAVSYFASTNQILYRYAIPMGLCNICGALLGSRMAVLKGNRFVRGFFLLVVTALIMRLGYDLIPKAKP
ncbi:MAG: rane protein [Verrucomicrobiales bacterium]|jgi:uncharacterized membrane protein YfcA|nr:rane protein [Verrucomicrobiales bacterium]